MSLLALALVLVAACAHATWNFAAKLVVADALVFGWLCSMGAVALCLPAMGVWAFWHDISWHPAWMLGGVLSGVLHAVYTRTLQHAYGVGDLNVVYPLARGTGPALTMAVALTLLGERVSLIEGVGALLIVLGIAVISAGPAPGDPARRRAGVIWGLLTGVTIASYTLWDSYAVTDLGGTPLPYFVMIALCQLLTFTAAGWPRRQDCGPVLRRTYRQVLVVSVMMPTAYVLVLTAMQLAPVALVAAVRETSIVIGALLAWLVLHERAPGLRLAGAVVVAGGITALVAG